MNVDFVLNIIVLPGTIPPPPPIPSDSPTEPEMKTPFKQIEQQQQSVAVPPSFEG